MLPRLQDVPGMTTLGGWDLLRDLPKWYAEVRESWPEIQEVSLLDFLTAQKFSAKHLNCFGPYCISEVLVRLNIVYHNAFPKVKGNEQKKGWDGFSPYVPMKNWASGAEVLLTLNATYMLIVYSAWCLSFTHPMVQVCTQQFDSFNLAGLSWCWINHLA